MTLPGDGLQAVVFVDGASRGNPGPAGAGVVIAAPQGDVLRELSVPIAHATNNVAEYTGVLVGLRAARDLGLQRIEVRSDSELLCRQLNGSYRVKNPTLRRLHAQAARLMHQFERCPVHHIPREQNQAADRLASAAARKAAKNNGNPKPGKQGSFDF
jgi:ribonuclease HI